MREAWQRAMEIANLLPNSIQWGFNITEIEDDIVFNIYAPRERWHGLRVLLMLPKPNICYNCYDGRFASYEEYNIDGLVLSLITPEEQHDYESAGPDYLADALNRAVDADAGTGEDD